MLVRRITVAMKRLPPVAACSLATHALVYRTWWPADGVHGYFGWYEPAVAVVSLASLVGLLGFLAVAWVARRCGHALRPAVPGAPGAFPATARSLAASSLAVLLIQESVERSIEAGHPTFQLFTPVEWLLLIGGLAATSVVFALGLRLARVVTGRVLGAAPLHLRLHRRLTPRWSVVTCRRRRTRPLAGRFALRAPPLPS
jgi:hypothetical protein